MGPLLSSPLGDVLLMLILIGLCRNIAFLRQNLKIVLRNIKDLCTATFLFSVICDSAPFL